jgi:hypothetical protein
LLVRHSEAPELCLECVPSHVCRITEAQQTRYLLWRPAVCAKKIRRVIFARRDGRSIFQQIN